MNVRAAKRFALGLTTWIGAIAIWYAVRWSGSVSVSLIPAPHQVAAKFWGLLLHESLLWDVYVSTRRMLIGVVLGIAVAVPVGFLLGWYRGARTFADPMIDFFRALPPIALIFLVIVYFGVEETAKLVILFHVPGAIKLADASAYYPQAAIIGGWTAANTYYDANQETLGKLIKGWGEANDDIIANPDAAIEALQKAHYSQKSMT